MLDFSKLISDIRSSVNDPGLIKRLTQPLQSSRLNEDLSFDSVAWVEMQIGLEDIYKVSLPCEEVNECKTLGDVKELINNKLNLLR